jgi:hypothetical protein
MKAEQPRDHAVLDASVRFPEHVIFRSFARETVALNLKTGQFHGLNVTAGRMVQLLERCGRPRDAIDALATEYRVPPEQIERDLERLLIVLLERELVEIDG